MITTDAPAVRSQLADLRDVPLADCHWDTVMLDGVLDRVAPDRPVTAVPVAAFNSSIS